jgi:hypothetical protein
MSSKLEETFNLPTDVSMNELENVRKALADQNDKIEGSTEEIDTMVQDIDPYTQLALSELNDREKRVNELVDLKEFDTDTDSLFQETFQAFRDTFTAAKDSPASSAGKMFEASAAFAKIALEAKNSKVKARLDAISLALQKRRLDQQAGKKDEENPIDGDGHFMDRNQLLDAIRSDLKNDLKK